MVNSVQGLDELRTFGWSLSSGVDVDNNQYRGEERRETNGLGGGGRKGEENYSGGSRNLERGVQP